MPPIQLRHISSIKKLRNEEFMHLYLNLMELTKKYATSTKNEYIEKAFEKMQKEVVHVKQLDVELKRPSETVKARNERHQNIKNVIKLIKGLMNSYQLSYSDDDRVNATYAYDKLEYLIDVKKVSAVTSVSNVIRKIRHTIEDDKKLEDALYDLHLMDRVKVLYELGEEFKQLEMQRQTDNVTALHIDKTAIRKEAAGALKFLFDCIELYYALTKQGVWKEMAEEVEKVVTSGSNDK